jgi:hypothetical protein
MTYAFGAQIATTTMGNIVINGSGQVYAITDTTFATPLTVTKPDGTALSAVTSNAYGYVAAFKAPYPVVMFKSAGFAAVPLFSPLIAWAPGTTYAVGDVLLSPTADPVTCITAHTSTSTYDTAKFQTAIGTSGSQTRTDMDARYIPLTQRATANGVATLGSASTVTPSQLAGALVTQTVNYSLAATDRYVVSNGTSLTMTLPDPTTAKVGQPYTVKNINSSSATVNSAGTSKTLDGAASQTIAQWAKATYVSDGTQWLTV